MYDDILMMIRDALLDDRVSVTDHALEELEADGLHLVDAESAILTGRINRMEPDAPNSRGPRYTVIGVGADTSTEVGVVCRFERTGQLIIITCYQVTS